MAQQPPTQCCKKLDQKGRESRGKLVKSPKSFWRWELEAVRRSFLLEGYPLTWGFGLLLKGSVPLWLAFPNFAFLPFFALSLNNSNSQFKLWLPQHATQPRSSLSLFFFLCASPPATKPWCCFFDGSLRISRFSFFLLLTGMELRKEKLVRWFFLLHLFLRM